MHISQGTINLVPLSKNIRPKKNPWTAYEFASKVPHLILEYRGPVLRSQTINNLVWGNGRFERQNQAFAWTFYSVSNSPSHTLYHSPSTLSAVSHLSVTVCRLGLTGIICRHQEQIISEKPAPYFGVFNFQIVLQDVKSVGQPPYNLWWQRL